MENGQVEKHIMLQMTMVSFRKVMRQCLSLLVLMIYTSFQMASQMSFTDMTDSAGIDHQFKVYEGMFGGGAVVFDLNNDGYQDLFITSGMNEDVLYLNNGDGTFSNTYDGSGLEVTRRYVTQGASSADINRDGHIDLFVTTITTKDSVKVIPREKNLLFINNGDQTFRDATEEYRLDKLYAFSTGASFGDVNGDGYPDLFVGNYFLEHDGPLTEINDATIVNAGKTAQDYFLINVQGKYFKDAYADYGLTHRGFGFGGVFTDYDNDGDQDLLVNNDFGYKAKPNYLLRNEYPKPKFTYVEKDVELDLRINAMGAAVGDYDNNGLLDYFVTNIKFNRFMVQGDDRVFADQARSLGTSIFTISWGANFADFDHDGDLDLYVSNGDLNPNCTPMGNYLFENNEGQFEDVGISAGVKDFGMGRGSVAFDMENDGDLDILVVNQEPIRTYPLSSRTRLFRNDGTNKGWLGVQLIGRNSVYRGLGSRVRVVCGDLSMIREIDGGGSSHLSQNTSVAHFGLGDAARVDSIIVTWSGGKRQVLTNKNVNQIIEIVEEETKDDFNWRLAALGLLGLGFLYFFYRKRDRKIV